jgi:uncharacterized phage-associated protein
MEQMRMQKLLYYCQVWSVALRRVTLFDEEIEAWVNGPVVPAFWRQHAYAYSITDVSGDVACLSGPERTLIDKVFEVYEKYTGVQLSEMTHREKPWKDARNGLASNVRSSSTIDPISAGEYYRSR